MFRDPLYDDAVFTRLELLEKHNFNIGTVKSDVKIELIKSDNVTKKHGKGCLTRAVITYQQQSLESLRLHYYCILFLGGTQCRLIASKRSVQLSELSQ